MKQKAKEKTSLNVLYLEDSPKDNEIISELLIEAGFDINLNCTEKKKEFTSLLRKNTYDVILSDFKLHGFDAFDALKLSVEICPDVPFICVSGSIGEEIAIELIKEGAADYVLKDHLVRLPAAVKRALDEKKEKEERKRLDKELQWKTAFLEAQVNSPIDGILVVDSQGRKILQNQRCTDLWKIPQNIVDQNNDAVQVQYVMNRTKYPEQFAEKIKYLYTHPHEISHDEIEFKDGMFLDRYSAPVLGQDGTYYGRIWTFRDITERKQAEDALRALSIRQDAILSAVPDIIMEVDNNIVYTWANNAGLKFFGDDVIGKEASYYFEGDQKTYDMVGSIFKGDEHTIYVESWQRRKDGEKRLLAWWCRVLMDSSRKKIGALSSARDITEQRKAEEALESSESFLNNVIVQSPYPMWISDSKGALIRINKACLDLLNLKEDEVMGKYNVLKDSIVEQQGLLQLVSSVFEKGETAHFEIKYDTSKLDSLKIVQKSSVILDTTIFPIKNMNGVITNAVIQHVDITLRKQMEEQMRQMQKMEGLGTLAGGIAHDFNNILGIILAYNSGIKRFKDDAKKLDLATETITKAVERGKTIVQQILTFARKTETTFGAVNVNDVVMEIMTMILETFPKVLTYSQNFEKGIPFINADRGQLYQALLNLCVNARDAMPEGGLLTINTRMVPGANLSAKHPDVSINNYICIEVSDTGEGMTEEIKKRIFEPFFTTREIGKGTGLGLSVVFGVVQAHNGFADVESEIGKGTTFRLYLPAIKAEEPISEKEEEKLEDMPGGTETLLVVEDEEMLMMSLQMFLVEKGYDVLPARDGMEALKVYQENKGDIALVLTDLGLPTITGLEVCQRIKEIKSSERMILATGYLDPEMKSECLKTGIRHFLYKPYDLKNVLKVVREVLDNK